MIPKSKDLCHLYLLCLAGEPTGAAGGARQPDRRAALRHGQALLGAGTRHGMFVRPQRRMRINSVKIQ